MNQTEIVRTANDQHVQCGTRGLLPPRQPNENLAVSDGKRILCTALRIDQHQMFLGAFGPEQTKIVYTFVDILRGYPGLNIRSVCTTRTDGAAGSYIMLGDIHGDAQPLLEFGRNIQINPWLEPVGTKVVPEAVIDVKIIAPAGPSLLLNALTIISNDYGVNIESMIHRTFHNMFDHGFDLLRQVTRGLDPRFIDNPLKEDEARRGRLGSRGNVAGRGADASGGFGTGASGSGGPRASGAEADGIAAGDYGKSDGTDFVTVTKMRLELPNGTSLENLKHDLELAGKDWEFRWEQRRGNATFDQKLTQKLFGGLN